ncbi:MAG: hypothetical protein ACQGVK_15395 [Myxococcota bacterium]
MALQIVNSVDLRPDRLVQFRECVGELAAAATQKGETWSWTAHQTLFGTSTRIHFASVAGDFAELEARGTVEELWARVMGEKRGGQGFARANECLQAAEQTISIDRPDLSYEEGLDPAASYPSGIVTLVRARPGHADAAEELIRKIAEAIPKTGDPTRIMTFQTVVGELNTYWTVRPLRELGEIDAQLPPEELLNQAFGPAEGGLVWRSGVEAIDEGRREIMRSVPELSNPA